MKVASILQNSLRNGEGTRLVIFFSGCSHHCKGCHNEHIWNKECGIEMSIEEILEYIKNNMPIINGVTLSGGEPFEQAKDAAMLACNVKTLGLNVWTYTGYTYEQLRIIDSLDIKVLLKSTDVLVDGRFIEELKDDTLKYRGSSNQSILKLKDGVLVDKK